MEARSIMLSVLDMKDEGGITDEGATSRGGIAADALFIVRFVNNGAQIDVSCHSVHGATQKELGSDALFTAWTAMIVQIRDKAKEEGNERIHKFLHHIANLMRLDAATDAIQNASG